MQRAHFRPCELSEENDRAVSARKERTQLGGDRRGRILSRSRVRLEHVHGKSPLSASPSPKSSGACGGIERLAVAPQDHSPKASFRFRAADDWSRCGPWRRGGSTSNAPQKRRTEALLQRCADALQNIISLDDSGRDESENRPEIGVDCDRMSLDHPAAFGFKRSVDSRSSARPPGGGGMNLLLLPPPPHLRPNFRTGVRTGSEPVRKSGRLSARHRPGRSRPQNPRTSASHR